MVFAAATGLRPGEWIALEHRDIDLEARVVCVRLAFRNGRVKCTKTEGSVRAVPLQALALQALELLPVGAETDLRFLSVRGGYFDLHNFRARYWKAAQLAAGIRPLRRVYDLRHTALRLSAVATLPRVLRRRATLVRPRVRRSGVSLLRGARLSGGRCIAYRLALPGITPAVRLCTVWLGEGVFGVWTRVLTRVASGVPLSVT